MNLGQSQSISDLKKDLENARTRSRQKGGCYGCVLSSAKCGFLSSQRDCLQDQVNIHTLAKQKIRSLINALMRKTIKRKQGWGKEEPKAWFMCSEGAVIAVLAAERLKALALTCSSLFTWTNGSEGGTGFRMCVGESKHRHNLPVCEKKEIDCFEALSWFPS